MPALKPWKKGQSGNPAGKPKGARSFKTELLEALRNVERRKQVKMLEHAWERALTNDKVLMAMISKVLPNLTHEENPADNTTHYHISFVARKETPNGYPNRITPASI